MKRKTLHIVYLQRGSTRSFSRKSWSFLTATMLMGNRESEKDKGRDRFVYIILSERYQHIQATKVCTSHLLITIVGCVKIADSSIFITVNAFWEYKIKVKYEIIKHLTLDLILNACVFIAHPYYRHRLDSMSFYILTIYPVCRSLNFIPMISWNSLAGYFPSQRAFTKIPKVEWS